ncbi:MAG: 3-dehydroquinate synthase [Sandaracinaceae bacterium]
MIGWVFLSGMMGSGKSTVAAHVARIRGLPLYDLDARIEERAEMSIPRIFETEGEAVFRKFEASEIDALLTGGEVGVVALGGGAVSHPLLRRRLLRAGTLITLTASPETLVRRVASGGRPLLEGGDVRSRLEQLAVHRAAAYAECHGAVSTDGRDPASIAQDVLDLAARRPIAVALGTRTYAVDVAEGARHRLASCLAGLGPLGPLVVVTDRNVAPWADEVGEVLTSAGHRVLRVTLEAGEQHKNVEAVARIWDIALQGGIDRRSVVVAVGGGVVGDLAGFAAATLMRGVRFVSLPTSLLAMVDASVGGKTGFDRAEGKNLVGAFHQPEAVFVDPDTLSTLPDEELRSGFAEVVKSAWLDSEAAVAELERDAALLCARDPDALTRAIRMSVRLKARVVAADEREGGARRTLNLGHTVGHAIEAAKGFSMRHGDAVALGMVAAFRLAETLGGPPRDGERMCRLLDALGLPTDLDAHLDGKTAGYLARDKKRVGEGVLFIVPGAPGDVRIERLTFEEVTRRAGLPSS